MCIIVAKEKGKELPFKKTLKRCFENNSDGCGLMYVRDGKVVIDKGYMTFGDFYKRLKALKREFGNDLKDKALVMHFRIGTAGRNSAENTHPYPITNNTDLMKELDLECELGIAHNGIISEYNPTKQADKDADLNDTKIFIRDYISRFLELNTEFYKHSFARNLILEESKHNKFAILDTKENIYTIGDFVEDNGIKYSNTTYKSYSYYGGVYSSKYYDYYDDYYYDDWYSKAKTKQDEYDEYAELGNPYDDYDFENIDLSTEDYNTFWELIDAQELVVIDNYKNQYYVGDENGVKELRDTQDYAIDVDNNIYEIDMEIGRANMIYKATEDKNVLYNSDYEMVGYYDFVS